ncbi:MAG TPA: co-chaperone GroES family protein [Balneolaceae bacterium]|nr:co-chaperone GroES family protein [Balneolaceae bacterium]
MIQDFLNSVEKFVVVGDRVLIKPRDMEVQTESGLVLPATVKEKEKIQSGYVVKTGPGYPIPSQQIEESWKETEETRYIGMQAEQSDLAIYLADQGHEIEFEHEKYVIVPHSAILLLIRDEMEM